MFLAKKIVTLLIMPLPLLLLLALAGLMLLWFSRRQHTGKALVGLAIFLLAAASSPWVANHFLGPLERQYPPILTRQPAIAYIVVLGGDQVAEEGLPATSQLGSASLARLIEGIRLYRLHPGSRLVFSGGAVFSPKAEAATMQAAALELGVAAQTITIEDTSLDTAEEATNLAPLLRGKRFLLVTSAAHLPRAMALFRRQGLTPIAAPTDYRVKYGPQHGPGSYLPGAISLRKTETALHEYLGLAWVWLRFRFE